MNEFNETFIVENVTASKKKQRNTDNHYGYVNLIEKIPAREPPSGNKIICYLPNLESFNDINIGDEFILTRKPK